jgi:hypothetical protein
MVGLIVIALILNDRSRNHQRASNSKGFHMRSEPGCAGWASVFGYSFPQFAAFDEAAWSRRPEPEHRVPNMSPNGALPPQEEWLRHLYM